MPDLSRDILTGKMPGGGGWVRFPGVGGGPARRVGWSAPPTVEEWDRVLHVATLSLGHGHPLDEARYIGWAWTIAHLGSRPGGMPPLLSALVTAFDVATAGGLLLAALGPAACASLLASAKAGASSALGAARPALEWAVEHPGLIAEGVKAVKYDWWKGFKKAAKALGIAVAGAIAAALASPEASEAFKDLPVVGPIVAGAVVALGTWLINYVKVALQ